MLKSMACVIVLLFVLAGCADSNNNSEQTDENEQQAETSVNEKADTEMKDEEKDENTEKGDEEEHGGTDENNESPMLNLPESKTTTIKVEGMDENINLNLYQTEYFSLYIPDMYAAEESSERITAYAKMNDGTVNENVKIEVREVKGNSVEEGLEELKSELLEQNFSIEQKEKSFDISEEEYVLNSQSLIGVVSIFSHSDRYYADQKQEWNMFQKVMHRIVGDGIVNTRTN
jgi:hypothetical protein